MSHFNVLVVLPKDKLQKVENANVNEGKDEWHNAYNHQWYHPQLEESMEPYFEQHEKDSPYMERDVDFNDIATDVYKCYVTKDWDRLIKVFTDLKGELQTSLLSATNYRMNQETGEREEYGYTKTEIDERMVPYDTLYGLLASEKFSQKHNQGWELFKELLCYSDEVIIEDNEVYDVYYRNFDAKWDWWVVGGRWRNQGDNGLFTDLNIFTETKEIPYWKEELGFKLHSIEIELGIEREDIGGKEYDELITDYIKSNKVPRFYDRETKEVKEYYDSKELLKMVTRKKETSWAMLFPEEGWIEQAEMGWFGMSSIDSMDLEETENAKTDHYSLTDNLIEKYKDTHIGLIVDCHI